MYKCENFLFTHVNKAVSKLRTQYFLDIPSQSVSCQHVWLGTVVYHNWLTLRYVSDTCTGNITLICLYMFITAYPSYTNSLYMIIFYKEYCNCLLHSCKSQKVAYCTYMLSPLFLSKLIIDQPPCSILPLGIEGYVSVKKKFPCCNVFYGLFALK